MVTATRAQAAPAAKTENKLSDTIRAMLIAWPELKLNERGQLGGDKCAFVKRRHDPDAALRSAHLSSGCWDVEAAPFPCQMGAT